MEYFPTFSVLRIEYHNRELGIIYFVSDSCFLASNDISVIAFFILSMPIYWLDEQNVNFPDPSYADEDGILAVGGDLSPQRLIVAYSNGIFPWFNPDDPIIWWSPNPRFVLYPQDLKVSKSMRPYFNQKKFELTVDQHFETVMRACQQQKRKGQSGGTWITESMLDAYIELHELGLAHSVEVWQDGNLVGGLYGVALGKVFFGESMFAKVSNASKFGFISLVRKLIEWDYDLIDCQQETPHLKSLGAKGIARTDFLAHLEINKTLPTQQENWAKYFD